MYPDYETCTGTRTFAPARVLLWKWQQSKKICEMVQCDSDTQSAKVITFSLGKKKYWAQVLGGVEYSPCVHLQMGGDEVVGCRNRGYLLSSCAPYAKLVIVTAWPPAPLDRSSILGTHGLSLSAALWKRKALERRQWDSLTSEVVV